MERKKDVGRLDIENPKPKWSKTIYLEDGKLMKTIHDGNFSPTPPSPPIPETGPLCFEATQANSTVSMMSTLDTAPNFEYSLDGETWQEWEHNVSEIYHSFVAITLENAGDRVYIRGNNQKGLADLPKNESEQLKYSKFVLTGEMKCGGNIMSLLDISLITNEVPEYGLALLFENNGISAYSALLTAPNMDTITSIGDFGCANMYSGRSSLTSASGMGALTTIGEDGCLGMYEGCTFNMSDDGKTLNFAFPEPPVNAGEKIYQTDYDVAVWMGNTNGFDYTPKGL